MILTELSKYVILRAEELPKQLKIPQLHFCPTIYNARDVIIRPGPARRGTEQLALPECWLESYFSLTNWNAMINCLLSLRPLTSTTTTARRIFIIKENNGGATLHYRAGSSIGVINKTHLSRRKTSRATPLILLESLWSLVVTQNNHRN